MSANRRARVLKLRWQCFFLFNFALSVALLRSSDSTNANSGKVMLTVDFESKTGWALLEVGGGQGALKVEPLPVSTAGGSNALQVVVTRIGERCGVAFSGQDRISVESGQWYDLTFRARTEKRENDRGYGLTVSLESSDGKRVCARTTLPEVGGEWRDYTVALHTRLAQSDGVLIITLSEPGTIWFDDITLKQRQTGRETRTP
jgi:hypothetical protein